METKKNNLIFNLTQTFIWVCVFVLPALMNWVIAGNKETALKVFLGGFFLMLPLLLIYLVNYHAFIPRLLYRGRKQWFFLCNILLLFLLDIQSLHPKPLPEGVIESIPIPENEIWAFYGSLQLGVVIVQLLFILLAVGVRQIRRNHELQIRIEEEKRKGTEAELTWLKNQLNPHFLFNTLNNISSLTQIDPDKAQDSIGQLSDLLRYALYESKDERVPLSGEVTFMDNYIDLMQLRCNEMTTVEKDFQVPPGDVRIAPLLFISLIENAFKHGVNARYPSFVRIRMDAEGKDLVFRCENSLFEKNGSDHIGSGIGLENMQRRLDLLYPDAYEYTHETGGDTYTAVVKLKGILS